MRLYVPAGEGEQGVGMVVRRATDGEIVEALSRRELEGVKIWDANDPWQREQYRASGRYLIIPLPDTPKTITVAEVQEK